MSVWAAPGPRHPLQSPRALEDLEDSPQLEPVFPRGSPVPMSESPVSAWAMQGLDPPSAPAVASGARRCSKRRI